MSWKTSLFGLLAAIGGGVVTGINEGVIDASTLPHWLKGVAALCSVIGLAGLGVSARDNNKTSEQVGAGKPADDRQGKLLLIALLCFAVGALLFCFTGCARFKSVQIQTKADGTKVESRQTITTFWDSQSTVAKLRASTTDKTQGLTVGSITEASEASNVVSVVSEAVGAAVRAGIGAAK